MIGILVNDKKGEQVFLPSGRTNKFDTGILVKDAKGDDVFYPVKGTYKKENGFIAKGKDNIDVAVKPSLSEYLVIKPHPNATGTGSLLYGNLIAPTPSGTGAYYYNMRYLLKTVASSPKTRHRLILDYQKVIDDFPNTTEIIVHAEIYTYSNLNLGYVVELYKESKLVNPSDYRIFDVEGEIIASDEVFHDYVQRDLPYYSCKIKFNIINKTVAITDEVFSATPQVQLVPPYS